MLLFEQCHVCGARIPLHALYCRYCGAQKPPPVQRDRRAARLLVLLLVLLGVVITAQTVGPQGAFCRFDVSWANKQLERVRCGVERVIEHLPSLRSLAPPTPRRPA